MKNSWFSTIALCILMLLCFNYREQIAQKTMQTIIQNQEVSLPVSNEYDNNLDFEFVHRTNDFHVKDYQNMLDAIYTILDNGTDEFTFYCDESYTECMNDFDKVSKDQYLLSTINNMVSPYNSYEKLSFRATNYGKITITVDKQYSKEEIDAVEGVINNFISNLDNSLSTSEQIKAFHDFVINNSVYDKTRADAIENGTDDKSSNSHKANGPLIDGIALCSGYSDAMKIFLDKIGVVNYKISNANHIWNLVYLDGKWLHLDLTWDDPITNTGQNILLYKFFLIDTDTLLSLDPSGHSFNKNHYLELSH